MAGNSFTKRLGKNWLTWDQWKFSEAQGSMEVSCEMTLVWTPQGAFFEGNPLLKYILFLVNHTSLTWSFSRIVLLKRKGYRLHIINGKKNQNLYKSRFLLFLSRKGDYLWVLILLVMYAHSFSLEPLLSYSTTHKLMLVDEKIKEIKCRVWFPAGQLLLLLKTGRILAFFTESNSEIY